MKQPRFPRTLDEFGNTYNTFYQSAYATLVSKTDAELQIIIEHCSRVTQTNCGWETYAAAPMVKEEAERLLFNRQEENKVEGVIANA